MFTKRKSRIVTTILAVSILATMFVGFAGAAETETYSVDDGRDIPFYLELPARGVTDLATAREKKVDYGRAQFNLSNVDNPTGYRCFLNVRDKSGSSIVGKDPVELYSGFTGDCFVTYNSWAGVVGVAYRPSGQTYSASTKSAFIEGKWTP